MNASLQALPGTTRIGLTPRKNGNYQIKSKAKKEGLKKANRKWRASLGKTLVKRGYTWFEHCVACHPAYTLRQKAYALGRTITSLAQHWEYSNRSKRIPTLAVIVSVLDGKDKRSALPWPLVWEEETGQKHGSRHAIGSVKDVTEHVFFKDNPFLAELRKKNGNKKA